MNASKVPCGGIAVTLVVYLLGVGLNYLLRSQVFEIVLNVASLGISTWGFIVLCQMQLRQAIDRAGSRPVAFRMPFAPYTSWLTLAFLPRVIVLMALDYPNGTFTIAASPLVVLILFAGWSILKRSNPFSPTIPSYELTRMVENDPSAEPCCEMLPAIREWIAPRRQIPVRHHPEFFEIVQQTHQIYLSGRPGLFHHARKVRPERVAAPTRSVGYFLQGQTRQQVQPKLGLRGCQPEHTLQHGGAQGRL